jgi:hypothetical protein
MNVQPVLPLPSSVKNFQITQQGVRNPGANNNTMSQEPVAAFNTLIELAQLIPKYDVIGMNSLVALLRHELIHIHARTDGIDSINKLATKINVSRAYLSNFRDGRMVCMNIMNRLAAAFNIRYLIDNYTDHEQAIE